MLREVYEAIMTKSSGITCYSFLSFFIFCLDTKEAKSQGCRFFPTSLKLTSPEV